MVDTLVVVPTYNERENIEHLVPMLLGLPLSVGVVVVDDNSPDGTGEYADGLAQADPERVHVIHRAGKLGLGTAYLAGFAYALAQPGVAHIMSMDADFSHHPRFIPAMVEKSMSGYDLVIGSRYVPGGTTPDSPFSRRLLSRGANAFVQMTLSLPAKDATAGFRCYQRHVLETLPLNSIFSSGYSFLIEMLFLVRQSGFSVGEVPIEFVDRKMGASKISRQEIYRALYTVLRLTARRWLRRR
ncbi:MAG: polyprenol monophosphomannose synthase [Anaerolineae bacterium]|nr:polyprenol monophosphomannose synthase [Anaerolineae bacterium]